MTKGLVFLSAIVLMLIGLGCWAAIAADNPSGSGGYKWVGMDADKIGEWDNGNPDGHLDGHFVLNLNLPASTEIKSILVYSADENGNPVNGHFWDTANEGHWMLGVFDHGTQLNMHHVPTLGTFSGPVKFDLYCDDSSWFKPGNWFGLKVTFGDGTKFDGLISIPSMTGSGPNPNVDLTGVWSCDDTGTYYIRQVESTVWWDGDEDNPNLNWANVAYGTISGNIVTLDYADVPEGTADGHGTMVLDIISNDELRAREKPESYGGSHWVRSSIKPQPPINQPVKPTVNPPIITNPWDDPSIRQLIDEWLLQQDTCVKKVYPGTYIDKWDRICGNTGTSTISCDLTPDHPIDWDSYHYLWYINGCPDYYPYRVQDYVELRQSGYSFDDLTGCKGEDESCY